MQVEPWLHIHEVFHPTDSSPSSEAAAVAADFVAMTTQGRHGFLDALRGSATEHVLRQAQRPLLTMPLGSFLG